jgi:hypothetical protein
MDIIELIIKNMGLIIGTIILIALAGLTIKEFIELGKEKQLEKVKEWLLYACIMAEKKLGGGTGQVKLRYVYDLFVEKFSFLKLLVTFEQFSEMVDEALVKMREMLEKNPNVAMLVGDNKIIE